jgi:hypothetical protein
MSFDKDKKRLTQAHTLAEMRREHKLNEMITVYQVNNDEEEQSKRYIYCALIPSFQIQDSLADSTWDLEFSRGMPSGITYHKQGELQREYLRYGVDNGVEPLIIDRNFHRLREDYREISEEFRLFHELYHDRKTDQYLKMDDAGNEEVVAVVKPDHIQIRLKEIRQFLAIKEMHLAIQFVFSETSLHSLEELELQAGDENKQNGLMCWMRRYGDLNGTANCWAFSRLVGKRLVEPLPKAKSGFWPFAEETEEKYEEFIIDVDENGDEIYATCNPHGGIEYLTPVHFSKKVLDKYYQEPRKYSVEDTYFGCGSLWGAYIDNHHKDRVCMWLGDLGRDLPNSEQQHWRLHNIPPTDGISKTFFDRQLGAQFKNSDMPEHIFEQRYRDLQKVSQDNLGEQWLLPLNTADTFHLQGMRIPATDEQRDFDEVVLSLTKVLIDSLNEAYLKKMIPFEKRKKFKDKHGISGLEAALHLNGITDGDDHLDFLRKLQGLRSSGSAHRKGRNYEKIAKHFGIENQNLRDVFTGILNSATNVLNFFIILVKSGHIREIVEKNQMAAGYAVMSEMIGIADSGPTDASVNHDDVIYETQSKT